MAVMLSCQCPHFGVYNSDKTTMQQYVPLILTPRLSQCMRYAV